MESDRKPVVEFRDFSFQYFSQAEPTLHGINLTIYLVKLSCGLCGFLPSALQLFLELTASALGGGYLLTQVFDLRCCALYAGFQRFKVGLGPLLLIRASMTILFSATASPP